MEGRRKIVSSESYNNNNVETGKVTFESALDQAGFGLYSWLLTTLNGLSIIAFACFVYSSTVIAPTSGCEFNTSEAMKGALVPAPIVAAVLGSILWGYLADRYGRRRMLLISFGSATVLNTIASISVNSIMLLIFQFATAFMASGQYSITMSLLSECVPAARRNLVVLIIASTFMLSPGIMSLFAIPLMNLSFSTHVSGLGISWNPWRTTLLIYGLPGAVCFVWMFFMQESPKFAFAKKGDKEAIEILKGIHKINNFNSNEELQIKGLIHDKTDVSSEEDKSNSRINELFKGKLLKYLIIMTTLAMFQQVGSFMLLLPTIADQFMKHIGNQDVKDLSLNLCSLITSNGSHGNSTNGNTTVCALHENSLYLVFGVGFLQAISNIFVILVVGRFGRRNMVMVIAAVCGVSGIIVNLIPNVIASAIFFVIFLLGIVVVGLYTAISVVLFPTYLRALAISLMMAGGRIVLFATTQIINKLMAKHCSLNFYIFASLFAASAIIVSFVPDERFVNEEPELRKKSENKEVAEAHLRVSILAP